MLTQVVFHGDMEQDAGRFTLEDIYDGVCKKMILRHPHVFGETKVDGSDEVLVNWDAIKRVEKGQKTFTDTLTAVPKNLPANWRAEKLMKKASKAGFAWKNPGEAMDKLRQESDELRCTWMTGQDPREELGDLMFAAVGICYALGVDPEEVLHEACDKFTGRFGSMERLAGDAALDTLPRERLLELWNEAKNSADGE